ncbi:MAG: hypothetical protein IT548_14955 [Alphaproteobacteria bacterium]|nr:hypothetical protein [Alphaproteobacteria bacterium]
MKGADFAALEQTVEALNNKVSALSALDRRYGEAGDPALRSKLATLRETLAEKEEQLRYARELRDDAMTASPPLSARKPHPTVYAA